LAGIRLRFTMAGVARAEADAKAGGLPSNFK
jgi:hypothetical protein